MILKLKLQYFGHFLWRIDSLEKTLILGNIEGRRKRGRQRMRWLDGITDSMDESEWTLGVGDGQGGLVCCDSWGHKESDMTEWLNWTELKSKVKNALSLQHKLWTGLHFLLLAKVYQGSIILYKVSITTLSDRPCQQIQIFLILSWESIYTGTSTCRTLK